MDIQLDKKPSERARLEIEATLKDFRKCTNDEERLHFLNTDGKTLPNLNPHVYISLAEEILARHDGHSHLGLIGRVTYRSGIAQGQVLDVSSALKNLESARRIAIELKDQVLLNAASEGLAETQVYNGLAKKGLETLLSARRSYGEFPDTRHEFERRMSSSMIAATAYIMTGQLVEAMQEMFTFVDIARKRGTDRKPYNIQSHLAMMYTFLGEFDKAERFFELEIGLARASKYRRSISNQLSHMAWMRCQNGQTDSLTETLIQEALSVSREMQDPRMTLTAEGIYAQYLSQAGQLEAAHTLSVATVDKCRKYNMPFSLSSALARLARIEYLKGKLDAAKQSAEDSLALAQEQGYQFYEIENIEILKQIAVANQNFEQALVLSEKHTDLQRAFLAQRADAKFRELETAINSELAEQQLMLELKRTESLQDQSAKLQMERDSIRQQLIAKTTHNAAKNELLQDSRRLIKKAARSAEAELKTSLRDLARKIDLHLDEDNLWKEFDEQFALVHPGFQETLRRKFTELSNTERKVCALLRLEIPSKDVCRILGIGVRGIESHRYNIRKKIGVKGKVQLSEVLANI